MNARVRTAATAPAVGRTERTTQPLALGAILVTVLTWGFSNVVIKAVSAGPLVCSFYRLWLAIPLLWLVTLFMPSLRRRLTRAWLVGSVIGGGLFALHQIVFFNSLKLTSVVNVTIIGALQPALVLLVAGRMFGELATRRAVIWSVVAVAGTIIVVLGSLGAPHWSPWGDALAVLNLFAFTAYFLASKRIRDHMGATEYVIGMTTFAGLCILALAVATGQDLLSPQGTDWLFLLFLAVFPGTLGHLTSNWAHPHVPAFLLSVMLLAVPVIAAVAAATFLNEPLNLVQIGGGVLVLGAIGTIVGTTPGTTAEELAESAAETDAP